MDRGPTWTLALDKGTGHGPRGVLVAGAGLSHLSLARDAASRDPTWTVARFRPASRKIIGAVTEPLQAVEQACIGRVEAQEACQRALKAGLVLEGGAV
jgi:hypothetical protein